MAVHLVATKVKVSILFNITGNMYNSHMLIIIIHAYSMPLACVRILNRVTLFQFSLGEATGSRSVWCTRELLLEYQPYSQVTVFFCFVVVDLLVGVEWMVGLKQHCNIPPSPHHYLFHAPRVPGNETTHIIHLLILYSDKFRMISIKTNKSLSVPNLSSDCYVSVVRLV